jgi:hypothetical protein
MRTSTNYVAQRVEVSVLLVQHRNNKHYFKNLKLISYTLFFYYLTLRNEEFIQNLIRHSRIVNDMYMKTGKEAVQAPDQQLHCDS